MEVTSTPNQSSFPKYQYYLETWGGFYNLCYSKIHGLKPVKMYFDSSEEREEYLNNLKVIEQELDAKHLAYVEAEGYHINEPVVLHRITRYNNKDYYSSNELSPGFELDVALYIMDWKWYPGCNDYPLGEEHDYKKNPVQIVKEWITGGIDITNYER